MPESALDPQSARREAGPATGRGLNRRAALLTAARATFERAGYHDTRVADIVREAGASHGTFYTYFDSKEAVFAEIAREAIDGMLARLHANDVERDPELRVRAALKRFIDAYRPAAPILALLEEAAATNPELSRLRLSLRERFVQRSLRGIRRWQSEGRADPELDAGLVAEVLGAMIDQVCYVWFNLGKEFEEEALLGTLTLVWTRALGLGTTR